MTLRKGSLIVDRWVKEISGAWVMLTCVIVGFFA